MGKIVYNKLVRDNIAYIIQRDQKVLSVKYKIICNKHELKNLMIDKLREECNELIKVYETENELSLEELADVLEVIDGIKEIFNVDEKELHKVKEEKTIIKGKFQNGIYLESVETLG